MTTFTYPVNSKFQTYYLLHTVLGARVQNKGSGLCGSRHPGFPVKLVMAMVKSWTGAYWRIVAELSSCKGHLTPAWKDAKDFTNGGVCRGKRGSTRTDN